MLRHHHKIYRIAFSFTGTSLRYNIFNRLKLSGVFLQKIMTQGEMHSSLLIVCHSHKTSFEQTSDFRRHLQISLTSESEVEESSAETPLTLYPTNIAVIAKKEK